MALRMGADAIMIHASLIIALAVRLLHRLVTETAETAEQQRRWVQGAVASYLEHAIPLTLVCLAVFFLMGIYTYGRFYQGRYRALVVVQAVSLAFLIYGYCSVFFAGQITLARPVLVMAWLFSAVLIVCSRVWSRVVEQVIRPERQAILNAQKGPQRHVLVVGGAGYIGSALLGKLLDRGHRVRLLDMMVFGRDPIAAVERHPNLEIVEGDFRHVEVVVQAMKDVNSVIHLGAIVGDPACSLDESLTIDVNLSATRMIAELAKSMGVERFVFASTCSVYGACDELLDERSFVRPISLYGQTKLASEQVLYQLSGERFAPTIVRFATIYGLSGRTRFDLVVNLLTAKARMEGKITVFGGDQWRPFVHVEDAAEAVAMILEAPRELVANQVFNVGSNEQNYTITEIGRMVHEHVPTAELIINEQDADKRNYKVSFDKIRNLLGFEPAWTVPQGIAQVLEAIASGDVQDYNDPRYSNVKFLTETGTANLARERWARDLIKSMSGD
jgi:nucleoside-diphosphate-sugar epimerase